MRRIAVRDPAAAGARHDYADSFAVALPAPDTTPPERWLGATLAQLPPVVVWITSRLGFSEEASGPFDGWEVRTSGPDVVHLAANLPLLHVDFIGRNTSPTRRTLTTLLTYRRPWLARLVWLFVGPAHRRTARWVLHTSLRREPVPA